LNIDESKIFYIDTSLEPEDAAEAYAMIFPSAVDFIFLGLGDNVHTASLFPYTDILDEKSPTVKNIYVEEVKAMRISLTAPLINQAKTIAFLVYGAGKAEAVHDAIEGEENYKKFPAQLIKPSNGEVHWFLDQASAKALTSQK
jgi:6-phosphogluconolactonase